MLSATFRSVGLQTPIGVDFIVQGVANLRNIINSYGSRRDDSVLGIVYTSGMLIAGPSDRSIAINNYLKEVAAEFALEVMKDTRAKNGPGRPLSSYDLTK